MTYLELLPAVLGSAFAVGSILVDLAAMARPERHGVWLDRISRPIRIRKDVPPRDNLRQLLAVIGSILLLLLALITSSPVYVALETFMLLSKFLWFIAFGRDAEVSERRKAIARIFAAVAVWVTLEILGLCSGFHRLGIVGLELLGCAYALQNPGLRNRLMVYGSTTLVCYAAVGVVLEPERVTIYTTQLFLNGIFMAVAMMNLKAGAITKGTR